MFYTKMKFSSFHFLFERTGMKDLRFKIAEQCTQSISRLFISFVSYSASCSAVSNGYLMSPWACLPHCSLGGIFASKLLTKYTKKRDPQSWGREKRGILTHEDRGIMNNYQSWGKGYEEGSSVRRALC